jgi:hypothetical protein
MPVHAIDHSISRKDGVNHNMLVLLNNFWIGLSNLNAIFNADGELFLPP